MKIRTIQVVCIGITAALLLTAAGCEESQANDPGLSEKLVAETNQQLKDQLAECSRENEELRLHIQKLDEEIETQKATGENMTAVLMETVTKLSELEKEHEQLQKQYDALARLYKESPEQQQRVQDSMERLRKLRQKAIEQRKQKEQQAETQQ